MKNLSLVLNVVLILAVGFLYYMHLIESDGPETVKNSSLSGAYSVAFINADSVLRNYDFFKNKQEELDSKSKKFQGEYQNRAQGLQKELNDYQRNINNLTIGQAKAVEESLMKKQQNLRVYQENLSQELLKEESKINQELYEKVTSFLQDYSKENGLELVVKYNQGSDVMYATDSMNITENVIKGLNERYKKQVPETADATKDSIPQK